MFTQLHPNQKKEIIIIKIKRNGFCVYGELELIIKTKDNKKIKKKLHYKNPEIVYVAPGTVHTLINNKNKEAVVVAYASKEFEKDNPDTYQVEGI